MIIGSLPIVEKATGVPLPGIFQGTLTDPLMTPIFQHGIDMTVVPTEGNAIFLRCHLIHLTAPAPRLPLLLHTGENTDYPHVGLRRLIIARLVVTMAWTDSMTKGCVMGVGNAPVTMTIAGPHRRKMTIIRGVTTATVVLCATLRVATVHGTLTIGTAQVTLKEDAILIAIPTIRRVIVPWHPVLTVMTVMINIVLFPRLYLVTLPSVRHLRH